MNLADDLPTGEIFAIEERNGAIEGGRFLDRFDDRRNRRRFGGWAIRVGIRLGRRGFRNNVRADAAFFMLRERNFIRDEFRVVRRVKSEAVDESAGCEEDEERRRVASSLLIHTDNTAAGQKRSALILGLPTYTKALNDRLNRLANRGFLF